MTSVTQPDDRGGLFIADFYPRLGAYLARQHESGYDVVASRARFLLWLAGHADALPDYRARIGQIPRLTAEEETGLGLRIQAGRRAEEKLAEEGGVPDGEARADLEQIAYDGAQASDRLREASLWLVVSLAERFTGRGVPVQDLIQQGNFGLIRAVQKYDHTKGYRFSTYATWWIRQAITRAMADQARTIRIPVHMIEVINKLARIQGQMLQDLGREPTPEELAAELELSPP